jgi:integrase
VANGGEAGFHNRQDLRILDKASINPNGKLDKHCPLAQPPKQPNTTNIPNSRHARSKSQVLKCPECGSGRLYKDGLRYLTDGTTVQRWLCRNCGYRFSEKTPLQKISNCQINMPSALFSKRQVCELLTEESKNLAEVNARQETAQREGTTQTAEIRGKIVEFAWHLKKKGLAESTIRNRTQALNRLVEKGADLTNPDSVETILATESLTAATKTMYVESYRSFTRVFNIAWIPVKVKYEPKQPFIPLETELDQLIAGSGRRLAAFLQVLKDTGARAGEACKLKWTDINGENSTISINAPEKGSRSRTVKVSAKTLAMTNALPKKHGEYVFNPYRASLQDSFRRTRNKLARILQNPRLLQIHFHTFRHFKASMEYKRTRDILHVQRLLGHRALQNTEIYTHLIEFENDDYHVATAQTVEEAKKLIESGFEYITDMENVKLFRKRK